MSATIEPQDLQSTQPSPRSSSDSEHDDYSRSRNDPHHIENPTDKDKEDGADMQPSKGFKTRASSSWHLKDRRDRSFLENLAYLDVMKPELYEAGFVPEIGLQEKPPIHPTWRETAWLVYVTAPVLLFHAAWYKIFEQTNLPIKTWHPLVTFLYYHVNFAIFAIRMIKRIQMQSYYYGVLDGENKGRDLPSDKIVSRLAFGVIIYTIVRTLIGYMYTSGERNAPPSLGLDGTGASITPSFVPRLMMWMVVLDLFFYTYHRSSHEVPWLWWIHRLHHSTSHPTALQSILADDVQESLELLFIPLLTSLVIPLSASEYYFAQCALMYVEAFGHSGIRADYGHPIMHYALRPLGLDLIVEDHDLHHRYGKGGKNYCKQTRIWDVFFGTAVRRETCLAAYEGK